MSDSRTISQLEGEGYPWISCKCCKGTVWVPFKDPRDDAAKRPERCYRARQSDAPGFAKGY